MESDSSREEMPRSELSVWVTVVSAACRHLTGFHKDALHGFPQAVLAGAWHGVNFSLTVDRLPILLPCHWQQCLSGLVAKADGLLSFPHRPPTLNCPLVQVIPFPFISKCAHLLSTSEKVMREQGLQRSHPENKFVFCQTGLNFNSMHVLENT